MSSSTNKIDISTIYEMFEKLIENKDKQVVNKQAEPVKIDTTKLENLTEQLTVVIEEAKKPTKVEQHYIHKIDIGISSNWFFFSWVVLVIIIFGMFWNVLNQKETINQFKENDLKYRYIRMQGQTNEENIYRLEQQFKYGDSIKIVRNQVEKYEELVREQVERLGRTKQNNEEIKKILKEIANVKNNK